MNNLFKIFDNDFCNLLVYIPKNGFSIEIPLDASSFETNNIVGFIASEKYKTQYLHTCDIFEIKREIKTSFVPIN